jgi:hypothetical protein
MMRGGSAERQYLGIFEMVDKVRILTLCIGFGGPGRVEWIL